MKKVWLSEFMKLNFDVVVDTIDNWKNMNESKKNFKNTDGLTSDAAVDTVDMRKLIC